jgi:hypothetical protein
MKGNLVRHVLAAAAALSPALFGCTSWKLAEPRSAPRLEQTAPSDAALVCVMRTSVLAMAVTFPTHDDGALVGATRGPGHFCYLAEPGDHVISIEADAVETAKLTAIAGARYFLKEEVDNIFGYVKCRAVWMKEEEAKESLDASPSEMLVGVPGSEKLPPDPPYAPAIHDTSRTAHL